MNEYNSYMNMKLKYMKILGYLPLSDFIFYSQRRRGAARPGQAEGKGERGRLAARGSRLAPVSEEDDDEQEEKEQLEKECCCWNK